MHMRRSSSPPTSSRTASTAPQVADAIARGIRDALPDAQLDLCPMADGGEGTVDALVAATGGRIERRRVTGPLPEMKVDAAFGVLGDGTTAVVEMAAASGLALLKPEDRNPLNTTTFGTGELLDRRGNHSRASTTSSSASAAARPATPASAARRRAGCRSSSKAASPSR